MKRNISHPNKEVDRNIFTAKIKITHFAQEHTREIVEQKKSIKKKQYGSPEKMQVSLI